MSTNPDLFQELIAHLREHAVRTDGPFTLRSGAVSNWYLDARQTTFSGRGARLIGEVVLAEVDERVEAVGGLTMGADPIAMATAIAADLHGRLLSAFSIRKEAKTHGTGGRLVGPVVPGTPVTILEDTTTTGGAMVEAIEAARESGLDIVHALAVIDRSGGAAAERLEGLGVPYRAIITPADLGVE
ncbi:MAG TPA: orotate phosphoribosyltransferase [Acidimicrobiia bacterium]